MGFLRLDFYQEHTKHKLMNKLHLMAHNDKNLVKLGDVVEQYKTLIGTMGTANGQYFCHLHHSVSKDLTQEEIRRYVGGWSKEVVEAHYEKPACDYERMFGRKMDIGNAGWDWMDKINADTFHPGLDINGFGGGNSDVGYEFKSPCNGRVVCAENWRNGWGNVIIIEEDNKKTMNKEFVNIIEDLAGMKKGSLGNYINELKEQPKVTKKLKEFRDDYVKIEQELVESMDKVSFTLVELKNALEGNEEAQESIKNQRETINGKTEKIEELKDIIRRKDIKDMTVGDLIGQLINIIKNQWKN